MEDPQLARPVDPAGLDHRVLHRRLRVDPAEEQAERRDERRDQHRPVRVRDPHAAEQQEQRQRGRRARHEHPAEDGAEHEVRPPELVLGERVPACGGEVRRDERAHPGVEHRVQEPAHEDAVVVREHHRQVLPEVHVREQEPVGAEQVGRGLRGGDHDVVDGDEEVQRDEREDRRDDDPRGGLGARARGAAVLRRTAHLRLGGLREALLLRLLRGRLGGGRSCLRGGHARAPFFLAAAASRSSLGFLLVNARKTNDSTNAARAMMTAWAAATP